MLNYFRKGGIWCWEDVWCKVKVWRAFVAWKNHIWKKCKNEAWNLYWRVFPTAQKWPFFVNHISGTQLRLFSNNFMHRSLDGMIVGKVIYSEGFSKGANLVCRPRNCLSKLPHLTILKMFLIFLVFLNQRMTGFQNACHCERALNFDLESCVYHRTLLNVLIPCAKTQYSPAMLGVIAFLKCDWREKVTFESLGRPFNTKFVPIFTFFSTVMLACDESHLYPDLTLHIYKIKFFFSYRPITFCTMSTTE